MAAKELIMLGTGSAMVTHCFNTCFVIRLESGECFMTDAGGGNGILRQLELAHIDYGRLHHLFLTHTHTDHALDGLDVAGDPRKAIQDGFCLRVMMPLLDRKAHV